MGFFDYFRSNEPKTTGKLGRKVGEHNFKKGIENLKSGDWDKALEFFEAAIPCFMEMDEQAVGNCLIALGILYGAAGEKEKAINSIGVVRKMCNESSMIGKFLAGLRNHIEYPSGTYIQSPYVLRGKKVDLFFHTCAQILISGITKGRIRREQVLDDMISSIANGLLKK